MRNLLLGLAIFTAALPAQAAWRVAESAHFIIYSEDKPAALQTFATELERFDAAMRYLRGLQPTTDSHTNKLTVFQVSNVNQVQKMMGGKGASNVYGFYNGRAGSSFAFVPRKAGSGASWDLDAQTVLLHEYAHHFMFRNYPAAFPMWFSEGWAEFNSTARFVADGSVDLGLPAKHRAGGLFYASPMQLTTLMQTDQHRLSAEAIDVLYSKGWLLTHYLSFAKERDGQLGQYLVAINKGKPSIEAAKAVFGDLTKLDGELHRYKNGRRFTYLRVPANRIAVAPVAVRELSPGASAMMPVMMQSRRGVDEATAKTVLKEARVAAAPHPEDPFVQLALAEAEIDAGNMAEAEAAADRVLTAEPANVRALVFKGRIAAARLHKSDKALPEDWKLARRWFTRANRAEPGAPEPLVHFYSSFAEAGEKPTPNAVEGLRAATALAAEDDGLRLMLGYQMLEDGKSADARAALAPVAYHPHGGGMAEFAGRVVTAIDAGGAVAGQAGRQGGWESRLIRSAASLSPQQLQLSLQSIGIAAQRPVRPLRAVARNQHRDLVRPASRARRAHRLGPSRPRRERRVGDGFPRRHAGQLSPHRLLEGRARHVQRQLGHPRRLLDSRHRPAHQVGQPVAAFDDIGVRKPRPQLRLALVERQPANAPIGRRQQHPAERCIGDRPPNRHARAAIAPRRGRHA